jgi:protein tyrosine phosphatase (PTP) superfamily phosphohydrolase (DUF442 family)
MPLALRFKHAVLAGVLLAGAVASSASSASSASGQLPAPAAATPAQGAAPSRPAQWAQPVPEPLVPNFYRVEDGLFRSAQPGAKGLARLCDLGVATVLNLRSDHDDAEMLVPPGLRLLRVPMRAWSLRDDRLLEALRIVVDSRNRPLLVHCQAGADRTGAVIALYRIVVQGWEKAEAIREMKEGGFNHHSFWSNITRSVEQADVAWYRRQLGLAARIEDRTPGQTPP